MLDVCPLRRSVAQEFIDHDIPCQVVATQETVEIRYRRWIRTHWEPGLEKSDTRSLCDDLTG